ncbi:MAG: sulfite dehydrogenase [Vicinamibacterales bacterium]|nr:sulfite dehydrogenase [Vicinamibacterales bacterium]MDP7672742.1 sulfite dehydrogenase [Vicinamibacterales bacterium]HJO37537.1 sulfite dehydrogenase [Vicinamibacterales bacterium]
MPKQIDRLGDPVRRISRRAMLAGSAGAFGTATLPFGKAHARQQDRPNVPDDPTKVQGRDASELGTRSQFEQVRRSAGRSSSQTPHQDLDGIITPSDLHYERHHGGIPEIDPDRHSLLIHGMVERDTMFTVADLKRFPSRSVIHFMECSGNGGRSYRNRRTEDVTPQQVDGLTSTSEWTGVPLATLMREVGVDPEASWILAEGGDAAVMTRSIPMGKVMDDALIAYGQNGEALRPEQGYPIRLFLPGWEGSASVKWIRRIEVGDEAFMTREETSKYTDPLPDGTARQFSFTMDTKSIITFPAYPDTLPERGWWEMSGLAWSGRGRISRVEISTDGGQSWSDAELQGPVLPICHTRFRAAFNWQGDETVVLSRATDETGYVQPTLDELIAVRGIGTRYHHNHIRGCRIRPNGSTVFTVDA